MKDSYAEATVRQLMTSRRATASLFITFFLLVGGFFAVITIVPTTVRATTLYVGGIGPGNFTTISAAINASSPGDTLYVYSGTYVEGLWIDKPLTLVGESKNTTIIDGNAWVETSWVNITGFTISSAGSYEAIVVFAVDNVSIVDNIVSSAGISIHLESSNNNTIVNNTISSTNYSAGVYLSSSSGNIVSGNTVTGAWGAIELWQLSNFNFIANNSAKGGIDLHYTKNNTITGNVASNGGIEAVSSVNTTVIRNEVSNGRGIWLWCSSYNDWCASGNVIADNSVSTSQYGIRLNASNNIVVGNTVSNNDFYGIIVHWPDQGGNSIFHNNIVNNTVQAAYYNYTTSWDDGYPSGGNYWSDYPGVDLYSGPDQDQPSSDGIGDTGFFKDRYPLMQPTTSGPWRPSLPRDLKATAGDSLVTLNWRAPAWDGGSPITNYRIYRGLASGNESLLAEIGNVLTYADSGLMNGQRYYYQVSARNAIGEGSKSPEEYATPAGGPTLPDSPVSLVAAGGIGQITLTWSPPSSNGGSPVTNYSVYRGTVPNGETLLAEIGNVLTFVDTGLGSGQRFYYKVAAKNVVGEGAQSNEASARTIAVPGPPVGLSAVAGDGQVTLTWSPPADNGGSPITNYMVYRGTVSGGESFIVQLGNVSSYVNTGLANGQIYFYEVSAVNAIGEGQLSNEASATPTSGLNPPSDPQNLQAASGDRQVTLTWTPPASNGGSPVTKYVVFRGTISGGETFLAEIGSVLIYIDAGLTNGQTYYYRVSAKNAVGEGPRSNEASATPTSYISAPTAPQNLKASAGNTQVTLSWNPPISDGGSAITNYRIYRGAAIGGESLLVGVGNILSYVDAGLTNGQTYFYKVSAVNVAGEGLQSNEANATPEAPPSVNFPPTCNIISPLPGNTVGGDYRIAGIASDVDGTVQSVQVSMDDGQWIEALGNTSWTYDWDTTLIPNGQHTIRARSYDGTNHSVEASVTVMVGNEVQQPPQETSAYQWAFWMALAAAIAEAFFLLYVFWKSGKGEEPKKEKGTEPTLEREEEEKEVK